MSTVPLGVWSVVVSRLVDSAYMQPSSVTVTTTVEITGTNSARRAVGWILSILADWFVSITHDTQHIHNNKQSIGCFTPIEEFTWPIGMICDLRSFLDRLKDFFYHILPAFYARCKSRKLSQRGKSYAPRAWYMKSARWCCLVWWDDADECDGLWSTLSY